MFKGQLKIPAGLFSGLKVQVIKGGIDEDNKQHFVLIISGYRKMDCCRTPHLITLAIEDFCPVEIYQGIEKNPLMGFFLICDRHFYVQANYIEPEKVEETHWHIEMLKANIEKIITFLTMEEIQWIGETDFNLGIQPVRELMS